MQYLKKVSVAMILACLTVGAQAAEPQTMREVATELKYRTFIGSAADSISTHAAISSGLAEEANPLVDTSVGGLIVLAGLKIGLSEAIDRSDMPDLQKAEFQNMASSLWLGVSANNLMLAAASTGPAAIVVGIVTGYALWRNGADKIAAARGR
jgi:hypothetical protein